jgi:hypothetical protein
MGKSNEARMSMTTDQGICHQLPLRPNFIAQAIVPRNLTSAEAVRLRAFLIALAMPEKQEAKPEQTA